MAERVLLVEDELFVALDVQMTIEDLGLTVDGPYASLAELKNVLCDLNADDLSCAVLDVRLPDGDIFPAANQLITAGVPIIFHSGHADPNGLASQYPGAVICGKPCAPDTLRSAIESFTSPDPADVHRG